MKQKKENGIINNEARFNFKKTDTELNVENALRTKLIAIYVERNKLRNIEIFSKPA
jgi:hypothetical protein